MHGENGETLAAHFSWVPPARPSEHNLHGELQLSRSAAAGRVVANRRRDDAEVTLRDICVRRSELRAIEHVEQVGSEPDI